MADDTNATTAGTQTDGSDELKIEVGDVVFHTDENLGGTVVYVGQDGVLFRQASGRMEFERFGHLAIAARRCDQTCRDMKGRTVRAGSVVGVLALGSVGVVLYVSGNAVVLRLVADCREYYAEPDARHIVAVGANELEVIPHVTGDPAFLR
jgi:hypothetical protein